jgi:hypothetical protein
MGIAVPSRRIAIVALRCGVHAVVRLGRLVQGFADVNLSYSAWLAGSHAGSPASSGSMSC